MLPHLKTNHKTIIIKTVQDGKKNIQINSSQESQEIDMQKYDQLIFDDSTKEIQWKKDNVFQQTVETVGYPYI